MNSHPQIVKILFLAANPSGTERRRLDEEIRRIELALERAKRREQFKIIQKWAVTDDDLRRALLDHEPEVVHFSGHGGGSQGLAFVDSQCRLQIISGESLARLFELCADHVRCVILNACFSEVQARAISRHIEIVVGMSQEIGDEAAIKFSEGFYDALGAGQSAEKAFEFGRSAIDLRNLQEHLVPIILRNPEIRRLTRASAQGDGPIRIVPRGLRSFETEDSDFFLELLPDPGRSDRLPKSISFWKARIEETDPDRTFRVGLIYGPSGCGKSSLVKAGLIPNLEAHIQSVYVEATPEDTEARLLRELCKLCPELPKAHGLAESLSVLSRGQAIPSGQKVLMVLDQFEQWLHAKSGEENTDLVAALRHCDGGHVQAIVLVRDDFWTATGRFYAQLGDSLRSDHNCYSVDLFYQAHGEKVLTAFGQAYGRVEHPVTSDQQEFIKLAAKALALRGMILPVRLALFSLVFQSREWTTKSLEEIGGVGRLEAEFFDNLFNFEYSNRKYRAHQKAAQAVLGALLSKDGIEIKRPSRPWQELLDASGYAEHPKKFKDLVRILDKELFLITPIEQEEGLEADGRQTTGSGERYYQLTHDFLVPSLRGWQSNKDQEASDIVNSIMNVATKDIPPLIKQLEGLRFWADPKLRQIAEDPVVDSKERLHASLALLPVDKGQIDYLYLRLLEAAPTELPVIRDALKPYRERLVDRLWNVLEQSEEDGQYLQAASALALYDPANSRWQTVGGKVAGAMVTVNAVHLGFWLDALRPARDNLAAPLATIFRGRERPQTERSLAFNILEDYASDQPSVLSNLLMDSEKDHFARLFEKLKAHQEAVVPLLEAELVKSLPEATEVENDVLTQRQARAAVAMIRLGRTEPVWPLLRHSPNPSLRSYLVNWLKPLGADPKALLARMESLKSGAGTTPMDGQQAMDAVLFHPETSERRALILALGGYDPDELSPDKREPLVEHLLEMYRNDPDAGIHGAAEWTLRRWKQEEKLAAIDVELKKLKDRGNRRWYVNSEGKTFVVIEGPVEF